METVCISETLASTYESAWLQKPEEQLRHPYRRKKLIPSSRSAPITRIKSVTFKFLSGTPDTLCHSVYTDKTTSGFGFQAFFRSIAGICFIVILLLYDYTLFLFLPCFFIAFMIRHSSPCDALRKFVSAVIVCSYVYNCKILTKSVIALIYFDKMFYC
jgi:hypothetical protein